MKFPLLLGLLGGCNLVDKFFDEEESSFQIDLEYRDYSPSVEDEEVMNAAVARWEEIISAGLEDDYVDITQDMVDASDEDTPCRAYDGDVDDIVVFVSVDEDLTKAAASRICMLREDPPYLTKAGGILLSPSIIEGGSSAGLLSNTFIHELGHLLGLKSAGWNVDIDLDGSWERNLLPGINDGCPDDEQIFFMGEEANAAWLELGGTGSIPMEDEGAPGTRCEHWDKDWFGQEIMTGWGLSSDQAVSIISIMALKDIGYSVRASEADPFELVGVEEDSGE